MSAHFSDPREVVTRLALRKGMKVADFGAGSGHYTRTAAALVGREGKVYAIDIQEDVLKHLLLGIPPEARSAVEPVWGNIERRGGTTLRDGVIDAGILANVLFQTENKANVITEVRRVAKPGAKILVVDWAGSYGGIGPAPERVFSERSAEDLFIGNGFYKETAFRAGPHHYGLIFNVP